MWLIHVLICSFVARRDSSVKFAKTRRSSTRSRWKLRPSAPAAARSTTSRASPTANAPSASGNAAIAPLLSTASNQRWTSTLLGSAAVSSPLGQRSSSWRHFSWSAVVLVTSFTWVSSRPRDVIPLFSGHLVTSYPLVSRHPRHVIFLGQWSSSWRHLLWSAVVPRTSLAPPLRPFVLIKDRRYDVILQGQRSSPVILRRKVSLYIKT